MLIAAIAAVPPTIMAYGALRQARAGKIQAAGANRAVNDVGEGEGTLKEKVADIDRATRGLVDELRTVTADVGELHSGQAQLRTGQAEIAAGLADMNAKVDRHLAAHQIEREEDAERRRSTP